MVVSTSTDRGVAARAMVAVSNPVAPDQRPHSSVPSAWSTLWARLNWSMSGSTASSAPKAFRQIR
ncbi:hypothetical protein AB0A73_21575 [Glycomyces sp. NPDC047369]